MSDTHTTGQLIARSWTCHAPTTVGVLRGDGFEVVAECSGHGRSSEQDQVDARRIKACWNACDGIDTDLLEEIPSIVGSTVPYRVLRAQQADLLEKLQMAVHRIEDMLKDDDGQAWDEASKFLLIAQASIAKAGSTS